MRRSSLTAAIFLGLAVCGLAAGPSKHDALAAIVVLERSVTGPEAAEAATTVVTYAQDSDEVLVNIGPEQLPWLEEKWGLDKEKELACKSMLLAGSVAGNVRSQIKNDKTGDDTYAGWLFAIQVYHRLKAKQDFHSAAIDQLSKMEAAGTLSKHAKEIQTKQDEEEDLPEEAKPPLA